MVTLCVCFFYATLFFITIKCITINCVHISFKVYFSIFITVFLFAVALPFVVAYTPRTHIESCTTYTLILLLSVRSNSVIYVLLSIYQSLAFFFFSSTSMWTVCVHAQFFLSCSCIHWRRTAVTIENCNLFALQPPNSVCLRNHRESILRHLKFAYWQIAALVFFRKRARAQHKRIQLNNFFFSIDSVVTTHDDV